MTRSLKHIIENTATKDIGKQQIALCKKFGGAWVAMRMPFSTETHYIMYKNPSSVPDSYMDAHEIRKPKIAYKGKLQDFTFAAKIREQNRGYGSDR
jgi:hypothetical protein